MSREQEAARLLSPIRRNAQTTFDDAIDALSKIERVIAGRFGDPGEAYSIDERVRIMFDARDER